MRTSRAKLALTLATFMVLASRAPSAHAGCGCDKPPPPVAPIRPAFASPGGTVTLFDSHLVDGGQYKVRFKNDSGSATSLGIAQTKRDFGDGVAKVQLVVAAPSLPPGPARVTIFQKAVLAWVQVADLSPDNFTMLQRPMPLAEIDGEIVASCYAAGVSSSGVVYIPVDVSGVTNRLIFSGLAENYPLLFDASGIAIYNTQGVLMQLLGPDNTAIYAITDPGATDSFELTYDRHEFLTYKLDHVHEGARALDPTDPAWHMDGTRHIDHDHLVLAIRGQLDGGARPSPGMTPPFNLHVATAHPDAVGALSTATVVWSPACTAPAGTSGSPNSGSPS